MTLRSVTPYFRVRRTPSTHYLQGQLSVYLTFRLSTKTERECDPFVVVQHFNWNVRAGDSFLAAWEGTLLLES